MTDKRTAGARIAPSEKSKGRALRRTTIKLSLTCVVLMSVALISSPPAAASQRDGRGRDICMTDSRGKFVCINTGEFYAQIPPKKMAELQKVLDALLARYGLDVGSGLLAGCGKRPSAPDLRVNQNLDGGDKRAPKNAAEVDALVAGLQQCASQAAARRKAQGGVTEAGRGEWVSQAVSKVDRDVDDCKNSGNPMIAHGEEAEAPKKEELPTLGDRHKVMGVLERTPPPPTSTSSLGLEGSALFVGPRSSGGSEGSGGAGESDLDWDEQQYNEIDKSKGGAQWALEKYLGPARWGELKQKLRAGATDATRGGQQPWCSPGLECTPTCSDIQRAWNFFKDFCERRNWRDAHCVAFLMKVNNCVSATLVMPNPEGGEVVCPGWAKNDPDRKREAWKQECEKKKMIMLPVGPDHALCADRGIVKELSLQTDPCNDPRVKPGPDGCPTTTRVAPGGSRPPAPDPRRPAPDPRQSRPEQRPPDPAQRAPGIL